MKEEVEEINTEKTKSKERSRRRNDQSHNKRMQQKEYKTWCYWVGKGIHKEMCKKFKFDLKNKW